ncbi:hypothetical protein ACFXTO_032258 [Malus domestica]
MLCFHILSYDIWKMRMLGRRLSFSGMHCCASTRRVPNSETAWLYVTWTEFMGGARELIASLGLFVSELNEEPAWKGKLISSAPLPAAAGDDHALLFSFRLPHLYSVPGNDGLRSKLSFLKGMDGCLVVHLQKVFD